MTPKPSERIKEFSTHQEAKGAIYNHSGPTVAIFRRDGTAIVEFIVNKNNIEQIEFCNGFSNAKEGIE